MDPTPELRIFNINVYVGNRSWQPPARVATAPAHSQLGLAGDAGVSTRYLSFVETGRAQPSREMILRLAECLDVPMRERNVLLVAGGFAPVFPERSLYAPS
jgi:DNA-binding XRE family transcriptional regulator